MTDRTIGSGTFKMGGMGEFQRIDPAKRSREREKGE